METLTHCPNCRASLSGGLFSSNRLMGEHLSKAINYFTENKAEAHCRNCSDALVEEVKQIGNFRYPQLQAELTEALELIPVISLQQPQGWQYTVIGMVTAQTVTGTGVLTEIASGWSDLLGATSARMGSKLKQGENDCFNQLRYQAAALGANAVIGTDIDYAEVGTHKGMLMVCMAGTAVRLQDLSVLGTAACHSLKNLKEVISELDILRGLNLVE